MDKIALNHSSRELSAHGTAVGLSEGLMGNSEVGHLNIGAGRIVWQDIVRIEVSIKKKEFHKNPVILRSLERAKDGNGRLHLLGLVSDGGVHSHINHLYALLETAKAQGVRETYVHFFGDGRDTAPRSAAKYCEDLVGFMEKEGYGELATVVGRYYAMDRDKRWERIGIALDGLVRGVGELRGEGKGVVDVIKENYEKDVTDEFLKPIIVNGDKGRIKDGDTLFLFNYRSDRMREIATVLGSLDDSLDIPVPKDLHITTMSQYNPTFPFPIAFPPQTMTNTLAQTLSLNSIHQSHVAETEKYAHVTFFFNGGIEKAFPNEHRYLIPSPKVPTYDQEPRMSVAGVADKVVELIHQSQSEFIMCNFAPPDMVGHTGVFDAAVEAVSGTDEAVGVIYEACMEKGYVLVITADHGNVEQMRDLETGEPYTAHTTNRVPFIVAAPGGKGFEFEFRKDGEGEGEGEGEEEEGALCDVAPTVLHLMGLDKPEEMTGRSLLVDV
ncbi:PGM protein [Lentinula boryana]|uniref:phosphoglycerate mutase (2,3-diphosphoglycerate-independent) n=1 Tax=Lentinula boryana TaxID=40481 RepID=A0ABQ8Q450_9AGAR|nr:PGM protein [Lentinula boryana]